MSPDKLQGSTIVVTGVTGQVARPLATALARDNRVIGAARFTDAAARAELEAAGVECVPVDLVSGDVGGLPEDADYVLHFAVAKTNDWERDLAANSGGLAYLMEHHRDARAFLHCSSTAVYKPEGHRVFDEDGPLGDNHGVWPFLRTYSICKIAAEGTARWAAERFGLPTTIARLSVPYGDNGGWPAIHLHMMLSGHAIPVHVDAPSVYHPLHADDIVAMVPRLLAAAVGPGGDGQLGRERAGQHRGVVHLPGRAGRHRGPLRADGADHRQRADRHHAHARAGRADDACPGARACAAWPRRCIPTGA